MDRLEISEKVWSQLAEQAKKVSESAYSKYSEFRVGAALLDQNGEIHIGCNVENSSYGLTMCAERNAVFSAVAHGMTGISALVVYTPTLDPSTPCGACRQVLQEFGKSAQIRCVCDGSAAILTSTEDLLPLPFTLEE